MLIKHILRDCYMTNCLYLCTLSNYIAFAYS